MNRNLIEVLKQMLVHVPPEHSLHAKLEWLIKDASYKAPEMQCYCWDKAASVLTTELGPPDALQHDWERKVANIFTGESE